MTWLASHLDGAREVMRGVRTFAGAARLLPRVRGQVNVAGDVKIGYRVTVDSGKIVAAPGARITIGDRCYFNSGIDMLATTEITVGDDVKVGPHCTLVDDSMHEIDAVSGRVRAPIRIGDNVWLAKNVIVLPGVTIGDGSVVAAGSVVTADVPPSVLAAGVPAKVIKPLVVPDGWVRR